MAKRLILCADNRSPFTNEDTYYKYCVGLSQVYANKHSIDFLFDELKTVPDGRHWAWARILLFAKYYPKYDEILWLDTDATIINHDIDVFSLLKTAPSSEWARDASTAPLLYACRDSPNNQMVCTGVVLLDCRNKLKTKELLNDWWNDIQNDSFKQGFPYEQSVVNNVWRTDPVKRNYVKGVELDSFFNKSDTQAFIHLTSNYYITELQLHEAKKYAAKVINPKTKKIGIFVTQKNFYSSGCSQNCVFIKQSLELLGYTVDLLVENYDTSKSITITSGIAIFFKDLKTVSIGDYETFIFGSIVPSQQLRDVAKARGIKTIMFHPMNSIDAAHIETFVYPKKADGVPLFESYFNTYADEVWLTDNHLDTTKTYLDMLNKYNVPVKTIPLTWSNLFVSPNKTPTVYEPRKSDQIEFIIIEPNMGFWKSAWYPLMIAEYMHKTYKNVKMVHLFNCEQGNPIIESLDISKSKKIFYRPRIQINDIVKHFAKGEAHVVFLSHQINVPLNYAYFDIMSSGFPFVHNSHKLLEKGQGYYYDSLETAASAIQTITTSPSVKKADEYLKTIHPGNADVLNLFKERTTLPKKKICIVVLTVDKERELYMRKLLEDMNMPFSVDFFQGFTPTTSKEYLSFKEENALESDGSICVLRSYAALFNTWASKQYDYLITLEDDIIIARDFVQKVEQAIETWSKEPSIDYINLGMLIGFNPDTLKDSKRAGNLYFNELPSIWGAQALLLKPAMVKELATMLHFSNMKDLRESLNVMKSRKLYRNRALVIQIDAVLPTLFRQGIQYPPLAIESLDFQSSRQATANNAYTKQYLSLHPTIQLESFYKP